MPTYDNNIVSTSVSGVYSTSALLSFTSLTLLSGIPFDAQLEVVLTFSTLPSSVQTAINSARSDSGWTTVNENAVLVIPSSRITYNTSTKAITSIDNSTSWTYTWYNSLGVAQTITFPATTTVVSGTTKVTVRRKTISNQPLVSFSSGSRLTASQLNTATTQLLYLTQELIDRVVTFTTQTTTAPTTSYIAPNRITSDGTSSGISLSSWNSGASSLEFTRKLRYDSSLASPETVTSTRSIPSAAYVNNIGRVGSQITFAVPLAGAPLPSSDSDFQSLGLPASNYITIGGAWNARYFELNLSGPMAQTDAGGSGGTATWTGFIQYTSTWSSIPITRISPLIASSGQNKYTWGSQPAQTETTTYAIVTLYRVS